MRYKNNYLVKLVCTVILVALCGCLASCGASGDAGELMEGINAIKALATKNTMLENDTSEGSTTEITTVEDVTDEVVTAEDTTEAETEAEEDDTYICGPYNDENCAFTGRVVKTDRGYFFVAGEGCEPLLGRIDFVKMIPAGEDVSLEGLETGDLVKIYIMCVMESYPPQTNVPKLVFIEKGTAEDVPAEIVETLEELGFEIQ